MQISINYKISSIFNNLGRGSTGLKAILFYKIAHLFCPGWNYPCFNLGVNYKLSKNWEQSLFWNMKAYNLDSDDEETLWNLGIASTALQQWELSRIVWNRLGYNYELNGEEITGDIGKTPIRLFPKTGADPEVVWCSRIDPARSMIQNIPLPNTGFCFEDILLNDVVPTGIRTENDKEYYVFDSFQLIEKSAYDTYSLEIESISQEKLDAILENFNSENISCECWTLSVRNLCKQCSEGHPHNEHDQDLKQLHDKPMKIGIAIHNPDQLKIITNYLEKIKINKYELLKSLDSQNRFI